MESCHHAAACELIQAAHPLSKAVMPPTDTTERPRDERGRFASPPTPIEPAEPVIADFSVDATTAAFPNPLLESPGVPTTGPPDTAPVVTDTGTGFAGTIKAIPDSAVHIDEPQTEITQPPPPPGEPPAPPAADAAPPDPAKPAATAVTPQDPRQAQMSIRFNTNQFEKQWADERQAKGWMHVRPFSVYVAAIGNHWKPKSWAKVIDMVQYVNEHGMYAVFEEIQDRCQEPYDALGVMRNETILRADYGGFEFVVNVDNDILPAPDTLFKMLRRMWRDQKTVMAPLVTEPGTGRPLHGPPAEAYSGTQPVRWNVLSFICFRTSIFRSYPSGGFWHDPRGADEGFHYQKLYASGHLPFIDTESILEVQQAPTYPLTIDKQINRQEMWDARKKSFQEIPDRRPEDPNDPRVNEHGVYLPFLPVLCNPERGGCGKMVGGTWWRDSPVCPACAQKQGEQSGVVLEGVEEGAPDGVYRRCKAIDNTTQCTNHTPFAHGYCTTHQNRVGAT